MKIPKPTRKDVGRYTQWGIWSRSTVLSKDDDIECASKTTKCYVEQNRGYKCKKHQ